MHEDNPKSQQRLNLRKSHPALYRSILTVGCMSVVLALNFWFSRPAFNPYGLSRDLVGLVFAVLGVNQLVFLILFRSLRLTRIVLAVSLGWMMFWGLSNTQQSFAGKASFQLPILFVAISILQLPLLLESPVNPFTRRK